MTTGQIEAFLAIYNIQNISKAATSLGITQSSLSTKIKILEEELGYPLFIRERGKNKVTLTTKGENFFDLAKEYLDLVTRMQDVKDIHEQYKINIAVIPTLQPLLETVLQKTNKLDVTLDTMSTETIYQKLSLETIDLAFTTNPRGYVNKPILEIYKEPMVIVTKNKGKLDAKDEVYVEWSNEYKFHHMQHIGDFYSIENADTIEELASLLQNAKRWAIVPMYLAKIFSKNDYRIIENDHLPDYTISLVYQEKEELEPVLEIFKKLFAHI